jgi:hypothetical protein
VSTVRELIQNTLLDTSLGTPVDLGHVIAFPLTVSMPVVVHCHVFHEAVIAGTVGLEPEVRPGTEPQVRIRNDGPQAVLVPWGESLPLAGHAVFADAPALIPAGSCAAVPLSAMPNLPGLGTMTAVSADTTPECVMPVAAEQNGLLCVAGGRPLGFDVFSSPEVYRQLHHRLLGGYLGLAERHKSRRDTRTDSWQRAARAVLGEALLSVGTAQATAEHSAVHRLCGEYITGRALVSADTVVCMSFRSLHTAYGEDARAPRGTASTPTIISVRHDAINGSLGLNRLIRPPRQDLNAFSSVEGAVTTARLGAGQLKGILEGAVS